MMVDVAVARQELNLSGLDATRQLAGRLAGLLAPGDVVGLAGELGIGKTTFARGVIRALLGPETEVPSPTFNLVLVYELAETILWHFDLYRLEAPEEAYELGVEDAFADGISLIEWPERLGRLLPPDHLLVMFQPGPTPAARRIGLSGTGRWSGRLRELVG